MEKLIQVELDTLNQNTCTNCYHRVGKHYSTNNYCNNCGSKLDWSIVDYIDENMTPKEKAIVYCKTKTTNDEDYLSSLKHNLYLLEHGLKEGDEYEGCPMNYGLEPCEDLCDSEDEWEHASNQHRYDICLKCWIKALK